PQGERRPEARVAAADDRDIGLGVAFERRRRLGLSLRGEGFLQPPRGQPRFDKGMARHRSSHAACSSARRRGGLRRVYGRSCRRRRVRRGRVPVTVTRTPPLRPWLRRAFAYAVARALRFWRRTLTSIPATANPEMSGPRTLVCGGPATRGGRPTQ